MNEPTALALPPVARVAEIAGPAGAGKTTLLEALRQSECSLTSNVPRSNTRYGLLLIGNTLRWLPITLLRYRQSRWFTWREMRSMVCLKVWQHGLSAEAPENRVLTVLDHGPIYRLAMLREFGPELTQSCAFETWWEGTLLQWAALLDHIIWLDAPDVVLLERINQRNSSHQMKGKPAREVREFLGRYRKSYEIVIRKLTSGRGPSVLRFDTSRDSLVGVVEKVLATLYTELASC